MSTSIVPFAFEGVEVRTLAIDGEPWFVLTDLCAVLGLQNPSVVASRIDQADRNHAEISSGGQRRTVMIVNEPGMYEVVIRSDKPEAARFRRWITSEVLPSIRRTGSYVAQADPLALDVGTIKQLHQAVAVLLEANERQAVEVAALAPRATAWDAIASAEGDYSVGEAAKILARAGVENIGPTRLFQRLADLGWTFRGPEGTWMAYAERIDRGHLAHKPMFHYHPRTRERVIDPPQLRVTLKGIELLRQRLGAAGPVLRAVNA